MNADRERILSDGGASYLGIMDYYCPYLIEVRSMEKEGLIGQNYQRAPINDLGGWFKHDLTLYGKKVRNSIIGVYEIRPESPSRL